jgi:hypothetical protein
MWWLVGFFSRIGSCTLSHFEEGCLGCGELFYNITIQMFFYLMLAQQITMVNANVV